MVFPGRCDCVLSRFKDANGLVVVIAGEVLYADVLQLPNGMSKVGVYK